MTLQAIDPFEIKGPNVSIESLLNLQLLAQDPAKILNDRTKSRKAGDQRSLFRGQGREFIEMKHYQTGDDVRRIDWKLTARKQQPFVRVMEEDRHAEQTIWLSLTASSYFGTHRCLKSVMLVHWAAFLIWRFVHLKHPLRVMIQLGESQQELRVTNKAQAALACQTLVSCHKQLAQQFKTLNTKAKIDWPAHWQSRPNLWLLSDFLQSNLDNFPTLIPMSRVNRVNFIQVTDEFDQQLPKVGELAVENNGATQFIHTNNRQARLHHQQRAFARQDRLQKLALAYNGQLISTTSQQFEWQDVTRWAV